MQIGFFGSGSFGLPTLQRLAGAHDIRFVVSQPDRPAGRRRQLRATPISEFAQAHDLPLLRPDRLNDETTTMIRSEMLEAWVVIAYGLKLPSWLLADRFACNLHGSLLPRWRGAAPIQRCLMAGDETTGVSVITLAEVMDAGDLLAIRETMIDPEETAGELHDRLAELGASAVLDVLEQRHAGTLQGRPQPTTGITHAPKLHRSEATCDFRGSATQMRGHIHGLSPWPGCDVQSTAGMIRLRRVRAWPDHQGGAEPGLILDHGLVACGSGSLEILEVQVAGGRPMGWQDYRRGHNVGLRLEAR